MHETTKGTKWLGLRIVGAVLIVFGLVWTCVPTLFSDPGPAPDTFHAIERRINGGMVAGIGLWLARHRTWRPWWMAFAGLVFWFTVGALVARSIGLALDGVDSGKQWMWFLIEVVVLVVVGGVLRRKQGAKTTL